jgi:hypothetical protein
VNGKLRAITSRNKQKQISSAAILAARIPTMASIAVIITHRSPLLITFEFERLGADEELSHGESSYGTQVDVEATSYVGQDSVRLVMLVRAANLSIAQLRSISPFDIGSSISDTNTLSQTDLTFTLSVKRGFWARITTNFVY